MSVLFFPFTTALCLLCVRTPLPCTHVWHSESHSHCNIVRLSPTPSPIFKQCQVTTTCSQMPRYAWPHHHLPKSSELQTGTVQNHIVLHEVLKFWSSNLLISSLFLSVRKYKPAWQVVWSTRGIITKPMGKYI